MAISARCGFSAWSLLDRLVHGEEVVGRRLDQGHALGQLDAAAPAAVLVGPLAPGLLDEDLAHRPRGGAEEVAAAVPARVLIAAPAAGRPRGPGRSAGGSARAAVARPARRPAGAAPRRPPAAIPPPTASVSRPRRRPSRPSPPPPLEITRSLGEMARAIRHPVSRARLPVNLSACHPSPVTASPEPGAEKKSRNLDSLTTPFPDDIIAGLIPSVTKGRFPPR